MFADTQRKPLKEPWICGARTDEGYIRYMTEAPDGERATVIYSEPYEVAKKIYYNRTDAR